MKSHLKCGDSSPLSFVCKQCPRDKRLGTGRQVPVAGYPPALRRRAGVHSAGAATAYFWPLSCPWVDGAAAPPPTSSPNREAIMPQSVSPAGARPLGQYLIDRLHALGVRHAFGIPGDYVLALFKLFALGVRHAFVLLSHASLPDACRDQGLGWTLARSMTTSHALSSWSDFASRAPSRTGRARFRASGSPDTGSTWCHGHFRSASSLSRAELLIRVTPFLLKPCVLSPIGSRLLRGLCRPGHYCL